MALEIPPWLRPPEDLGAQYLGGVRAGAAIQQEQARLTQETNLANMRAALQAQESERQNMLEQQRMAQQHAYQQQQLGIQQQELAQAQQLNQIKVKDAAQRFQAQQQFQNWLQLNPDKDPSEGILKFFPGTDESMQGYGTLAHNLFLSKRRIEPPTVVNMDVNGRAVPFLQIPEASGNYRMQAVRDERSDVEGRMMRMHELSELERRRDRLQAELDKDPMAARFLDADPSKLTKEQLPMYNALQKRKQMVDDYDRRIEEAYKRRGQSYDDEDNFPEPGDKSSAPSTGVKVVSIRQKGAPEANQAAAQVPAGPTDTIRPQLGVVGDYGLRALSPPQAAPQAEPPPPQAPSAPSVPGPAFRPYEPTPKATPPQETLPTTHASKPLYEKSDYKDKSYNDLVKSMHALSPADLVRAAKRMGVEKTTYDSNSGVYYIPGDSMSKDEFIDWIADLAFKTNLSPIK